MTDLSVSMAWLEWRDSQFEAISEQIEDAMPALLVQLDAWVDGASLFSLLKLVRTGPGKSADQISIINAWKAEQLRRAVRRAETAMTDALRALPSDPLAQGMPGLELGTLMPAAAGMGLLAASFAAIPTVVSFATVTTSSLAFFSVATVSLPLLALGTAAVVTAAYTGSSLVARSQTRLRESAKSRLRAWCYRQMLGLGGKRGERCFLSDLQAVVMVAGRTRMEERI